MDSLLLGESGATITAINRMAGISLPNRIGSHLRVGNKRMLSHPRPPRKGRPPRRPRLSGSRATSVGIGRLYKKGLGHRRLIGWKWATGHVILTETGG